MQNRILGSCLSGVIAGMLWTTATVSAPAAAEETPEAHNARMKWWREARFGMFIHWGVYAVPAGTYHGKRINGIGEWIMNRAKIPVAEYKTFAAQFNPVDYDPDAWVLAAKNAGMKYLIITSKHHDGFALFDSKVTDWDVVDATPYGKDLLKPLAEACHRHGIKLGFYYSEAQDWCHPGGAAAGGHWDKAQDGSMDRYLETIAVPQVREILSNYGRVSVLWWDTPKDMTTARADMLRPLIKLQPGIITNNRLGGGYRGDTDTPEQHIPPTGIPGRDWETCMTMNGTWGYKSYDDNWKSTETLIHNLVDIASKGGNYLLNVGPTAAGRIPEPSLQRLREIGRWMEVNGEAIYATTASPFKKLPWGRCTKKVAANGATLYLHVFDWPGDGMLTVPGLRNDVTVAYLLSDKARRPLVTDSVPEGVRVTLPHAAPDPISSTVVLEVSGPLKIEAPRLRQAADGSLTLHARTAEVRGDTVRYEHTSERDNIGFWTDPSDWVQWPFLIDRPGRFEVRIVSAALRGASLRLSIGGVTLEAKTPTTGDWGKFEAITAGTLELPAGPAELAVHPVVKGWAPVNLQTVILKPVAQQ